MGNCSEPQEKKATLKQDAGPASTSLRKGTAKAAPPSTDLQQKKAVSTTTPTPAPTQNVSKKVEARKEEVVEIPLNAEPVKVEPVERKVSSDTTGARAAAAE